MSFSEGKSTVVKEDSQGFVYYESSGSASRRAVFKGHFKIWGASPGGRPRTEASGGKILCPGWKDRAPLVPTSPLEHGITPPNLPQNPLFGGHVSKNKENRLAAADRGNWKCKT